MTLLGCLLIIISLIYYEKRKTAKVSAEASKKFWERENEANLTRRKDISALDYIFIPFDRLPFSEESDLELTNLQKNIKNFQDSKFLNLTGLSNTDISLAYGRANLDILSEYDQNFTHLTRLLQKWASLLHQAGRQKEAEQILLVCLDCSTDISASYVLLATIYAENGNIPEIERVLSSAESINSLLKEATLSELHDILNRCYASDKAVF